MVNELERVLSAILHVLPTVEVQSPLTVSPPWFQPPWLDLHIGSLAHLVTAFWVPIKLQ